MPSWHFIQNGDEMSAEVITVSDVMHSAAAGQIHSCLLEKHEPGDERTSELQPACMQGSALTKLERVQRGQNNPNHYAPGLSLSLATGGIINIHVVYFREWISEWKRSIFFLVGTCMK